MDEIHCFIRIYGTVPANVRGLCSVIENVLEAVELEEEKEIEAEAEIEKEKEASSHDSLCKTLSNEEEVDQRGNEGRITSEKRVIASKEDPALRIELLLGLTSNGF